MTVVPITKVANATLRGSARRFPPKNLAKVKGGGRLGIIRFYDENPHVNLNFETRCFGQATLFLLSYGDFARVNNCLGSVVFEATCEIRPA